MVTRVGREDAAKKLVIAGPHGDERNAQRLIMAAQRHFIQYGAPPDTVLYFIPCLSPTMCFADARGIPNEFLGGRDGVHMGQGPYKPKDLTIPRLHDAMTGRLRSSLQSQLDPTNPNVGVDANRDYYLSLPSNQYFFEFINKVKPSVFTTTETTVDIYDPIDGTVEKKTGFSIDNFRVLMIHGYEDRSLGGAVYGPYLVKQKGKSEDWPARMSLTDKNLVNEIRDVLVWGKLDPTITVTKERYKNNTTDNDPFLYLFTEHDAKKYQGEWSIQLYAQHIWSADIELPQAYNEGVREAGYDRDTVGAITGVLNQFIGLVKGFPWVRTN
jgi:hypothetical protein